MWHERFREIATYESGTMDDLVVHNQLIPRTLITNDQDGNTHTAVLEVVRDAPEKTTLVQDTNALANTSGLTLANNTACGF